MSFYTEDEQASSASLSRDRVPPNVDVGVFWDLENVRIPKGFPASIASARMREVVIDHGRIIERRVYFDSQRTKMDRETLDQTGFTLVDCPTRGEKETLDKKLIVDVMHFAWSHHARRSPCCVVLVTSDGDYAYALQDPRPRRQDRRHPRAARERLGDN